MKILFVSELHQDIALSTHNICCAIQDFYRVDIQWEITFFFFLKLALTVTFCLLKKRIWQNNVDCDCCREKFICFENFLAMMRQMDILFWYENSLIIVVLHLNNRFYENWMRQWQGILNHFVKGNVLSQFSVKIESKICNMSKN